MRPRHAAVISLLLAFSVAAGAFAAQRTMATASHASAKSSKLSPVLAGRAHALDRMETSLRRALAQRPPALPKMPRFKKLPVATAAPARVSIARTSSSGAPRTIFVRPPAHIVTVHRHGGEHEDDEGSSSHGLLAGNHGAHGGGGGDD